MLMRSPLGRDRRSPPGFIKPCQPTLSHTVPTGPEWVHEIKHDGFRLVARKDGEKVRLWSRRGRQIGGAHVVANTGVVPSSWHIADTGDYDANGKADILWRNDDG